MNDPKSLQDALRQLPSVNDVLADAALQACAEGLDHNAVVHSIRATLDGVRGSIRESVNGSAATGKRPAQGDVSREVIIESCRENLAQLRRSALHGAINATGIIIHTGLGRAPLAESAIEAIQKIAGGYCDIAVSREDGGRRKRSTIVEGLLQTLTGCEAALVVNNNAAAVMLALAAHSRGGEVIVSRGQLVEIGGSFRLPEVMESAGARLREVGTTNRTRIADYENAIGESTAALMRIHPSNFDIVGFTESASIQEIADLAHSRDLIAIDDIGGGALIDFSAWGLEGESLAADSIAAGADLVLFSGDKLLGGPQAGIIIGRAEAVGICARHPMMRALRVDKLSLAALEATLRLYLEPAKLAAELPILRMIAENAESVRRRANRLRTRVKKLAPGVSIEIEKDVAHAGGGSTPSQSLASWIVVIAGTKSPAEDVRRRLRLGEPAVFARVRRDRIELDMRAVADSEIEALASVLAAALASESGNPKS